MKDLGHPNEDTQKYMILELRGEVGRRIGKICRFMSPLLLGTPLERFSMDGRLASTPLKEKERGDYEKNGKITLREIKIAPGKNFWVSRSKCSTISYSIGRSNRTRTEKTPLDLAIGMRPMIAL